ncbi:MAG: TIGR03621 family F420-dependent LLM class oxidoreductase [Actinomycetota bacterium]|nr:TIGR03621 family F420-dependent LLM class oxidoreductase [Actinomycetota bacterium]
MSPHQRPFRFGVELQGPIDGLAWAETAREVESLGYSTLFVPDHFHSGLGPITAMATALAATTTLTVAPLVLACDFRHPAVLAKEIASIDLMFPGRVELGVGAGYNPLDYSRSGIRMDPPGRRVSRLMEYVRVLRLLFTGEVVSFAGDEFQLEEITGTPLPATPGGPRILVAGGGPRLLGFAGAEADIVGVNPSTAAGRGNPDTFRDALPPSIDAKVALVRAAAGERWDSLELNAWTSTAAVTDAPHEKVAALAGFAGVSTDEVLDSPIVLVGSEQEIADRLHERRERWGYSYTCVQAPLLHEFAGVVAQLAAG